MMDANGRWGVHEAIDWMHDLAAFDPWWIEEPTSPDDVLGHATIREAIAPIGVATGEQCQNRVLFKQFLQAGCDGLLPDRQLPARRRERGAVGAADGGEVRRPRLPARWRRRPVRGTSSTWRHSTTSRSAVRSIAGSWSSSITCTSTSSIPSSSTAAGIDCRSAGLQHHDEAGIAARVRISARLGVDGLGVAIRRRWRRPRETARDRPQSHLAA